MAFPTDPLDPENSPVDQVRLAVGDIDPYDVEFSEELYNYFLLSNSGEVIPAAVQALKALVAKYASAMDEVVGDVEVNVTDRYNGYKDLLDSYLNDPAYGLLGVITPFAGGLSFREKRSDNLNRDLRSSPFSIGSSFKRNELEYAAPYNKSPKTSLNVD